MERKLATVLFVDLVDSTGLVGAADPEVVRRRVTAYFERAAGRIQAHGGTVEKFAGDAVMAVFGVPRAHEDDAERAVRAAFDVLAAVEELGLEARAGIESGEVVADDGDSTFATGEAVNVAARLQQSGAPGTVTLGPGARRLTVDAVEAQDIGAVEVRGLAPVWSWRALRLVDRRVRRVRAPLVGREHELQLLHNLYERALDLRRAHLATVYGEPGVGKSRLVTEFTDGVERATVLTGRALPYGEGVAFWPIASMVKASAGITDDDPAAEAFEKLRRCCESDAVADLLGVALGVLGAADDPSAGEELQWATLRWAEELAAGQPLILVFEDVQWADERLLDVIEHLARSLRSVPVLLVCLARFELLDRRPAWSGGNTRAVAIELGPLDERESGELADALLPTDAGTRALLLAKAEGNPLFLEETAQALRDCADDTTALEVPDTVQALIAARIDRLRPAEKRVLQRAAVVGRVFWRGALEHLAPGLDLDGPLETLLERELIVPEERSTISGDRAYRFKHVLIRDVAYAGLTKAERANHHRAHAEWVAERAPDELVEIRAYHLDRAVTLLTELEGSAPAESAELAAAALEEAGERARGRDSFSEARRLFHRALELAPTVGRRYGAAHAARQLGDFGAVATEMELVREEAHRQGDASLEGRALTALSLVALTREGDLARSEALAVQALRVLPDDDVGGRVDALGRLAAAAWWPGDLERAEAHTREALALATRAGRRDLRVSATLALQWLLELQLELDAADDLLDDLEPGGERIHERANLQQAVGSLRRIQGRTAEAAAALEEARGLFVDAGASGSAAWMDVLLGWIALVEGDVDRALRAFRAAVRVLAVNQDHGRLSEAERGLAEALLAAGKVGEAEQHALTGREVVAGGDLTSTASTTMTLGLVRAAQGRDEEAERLLRESLQLLRGTQYRLLELEPLVALARFLRAHDRKAEAEELEALLPERVAGWLGTADASRPTVHI